MSLTAPDSLRALLDTLHPPCEAAPTLFPEQPCRHGATWIVRVYSLGFPLGTYIVCNDHTQRAIEHRNTCPQCSRTLILVTEHI